MYGNFGSVDGDGAAAMRYTEARMSKIAMECSRISIRITVDFRIAYSQEEKERSNPPFLDFPNVLVRAAGLG